MSYKHVRDRHRQKREYHHLFTNVQDIFVHFILNNCEPTI